MPPQIRKAKSRDIHQLAELAREGYQSSPVYSFVRTKARQYPEDTAKSYREEFRVLLANPKLMFTVLEVDNNDVDLPISRATRVECHSQKLPRWECKDCSAARNEVPPRRIVGFAIWRLGTDSKAIEKSVRQKFNYLCVSIRAQLTSLVWKPRDTNRTRAAKIDKLCHEAQKYFEEDSMELEQMVVHPDFQRRRYGTELGKKGLCVAREEGRAVGVIATPMGEKLYESLGFVHVGKIEAVDEDARCSLAIQVWKEEMSEKA